jgi:hypothetical protein
MLAGSGTAAAAALTTTLSILAELPKTNRLGNTSFKELTTNQGCHCVTALAIARNRVSIGATQAGEGDCGRGGCRRAQKAPARRAFVIAASAFREDNKVYASGFHPAVIWSAEIALSDSNSRPKFRFIH